VHRDGRWTVKAQGQPAGQREAQKNHPRCRVSISTTSHRSPGLTVTSVPPRADHCTEATARGTAVRGPVQQSDGNGSILPNVRRAAYHHAPMACVGVDASVELTETALRAQSGGLRLHGKPSSWSRMMHAVDKSPSSSVAS